MKPYLILRVAATGFIMAVIPSLTHGMTAKIGSDDPITVVRLDNSVDVNSKSAVIALFRHGYVQNYWAKIQDTGADWDAGTPGTADPWVEERMIGEINCVRNLVGLNSATLITDPVLQDNAMQGAMVEVYMHYTQNTITHVIKSTDKYYTDGADVTVGHSSICAAGDVGENAVEGLGGVISSDTYYDPIWEWICEDGTTGNRSAGHMMSILAFNYQKYYLGYSVLNNTDKKVTDVACVLSRGQTTDNSKSCSGQAANYDPRTNFYAVSWPCEGYFPKAFMPFYWTLQFPFTDNENNGYEYTPAYNSPDDFSVKVTANGQELAVTKYYSSGTGVTWSIDSYFSVMDTLRNQGVGAIDNNMRAVPLKDVIPSGDVVYDVTVTVPIYRWGVEKYADAKVTIFHYTFTAFDWPQDGGLTYVIFPDELQVQGSWKYNSWLNYYYTGESDWIYVYDLNTWMYVMDAGNFGTGGTYYDDERNYSVPALSETNYSFYAYVCASDKNSVDGWVYCDPKFYPWVYSYTAKAWAKL
jgi:hypothetical protein